MKLLQMVYKKKRRGEADGPSRLVWKTARAGGFWWFSDAVVAGRKRRMERGGGYKARKDNRKGEGAGFWSMRGRGRRREDGGRCATVSIGGVQAKGRRERGRSGCCGGFCAGVVEMKIGFNGGGYGVFWPIMAGSNGREREKWAAAGAVFSAVMLIREEGEREGCTAAMVVVFLVASGC
ncbi:hypothetical protein HAX54_025022 [Datura stramonium]|uniref:Uncharacterized protein n=1 Tax=Datura stramonium TaxID=4076 RepID=A0ABS8Y7T0_DATST|nr:hypothetical protein [Datura stramonium]